MKQPARRAKKLMRYTKKDLVSLLMHQQDIAEWAISENERALKLIDRQYKILEDQHNGLIYIKTPCLN